MSIFLKKKFNEKYTGNKWKPRTHIFEYFSK